MQVLQENGKMNNSSVAVMVETSCVVLFGDFLKENTKRMHCICVLQDDVPEVQEFFLVNLTSVELLMNHTTSSPPRLGKKTCKKIFFSLIEIS